LADWAARVSDPRHSEWRLCAVDPVEVLVQAMRQASSRRGALVVDGVEKVLDDESGLGLLVNLREVHDF